jgi:hypothetical protein
VEAEEEVLVEVTTHAKGVRANRNIHTSVIDRSKLPLNLLNLLHNRVHGRVLAFYPFYAAFSFASLVKIFTMYLFFSLLSYALSSRRFTISK